MALANVERWRSAAARAVAATGNVVPVSLVLAIIHAESRGIPSATRGEVKLNDASIGLMQLLGATAKTLGYKGIVGDKAALTGLYDPDTNILYGTKLLSGLYKQLGSVEDAVSAYNGGIRPSLGFGRKYAGDKPVTVCLARDQQGKCIKSRVVTKGNYGNAEYVSEVMKNVQGYGTAQQLGTVTVIAKPDAPSGSASLNVLLIVAAVVLLLLLLLGV
jgi:soluble lytic murein transglycosylase-like protein